MRELAAVAADALLAEEDRPCAGQADGHGDHRGGWCSDGEQHGRAHDVQSPLDHALGARQRQAPHVEGRRRAQDLGRECRAGQLEQAREHRDAHVVELLERADEGERLAAVGHIGRDHDMLGLEVGHGLAQQVATGVARGHLVGRDPSDHEGPASAEAVDRASHARRALRAADDQATLGGDRRRQPAGDRASEGQSDQERPPEHERRLHVPRGEDEPVAGERAEQREQGRELRQPRHFAQGALPQAAAWPRVEAGDLGQHDRDGRRGDRHRLQRGAGHELDPDAQRECDGRRVGGQQQHRHGLRMARRRDERPRHAPEPAAVEFGHADRGRRGPGRSISSQRRAGRGGGSHR